MNIDALSKLTYGMYVVSTIENGKMNGYLGNTAMQISAEPNMVAVACSKNNYTAKMIESSQLFSISILNKKLSKETIKTFGYTSGKDADKFADAKYTLGDTGCPILLNDTSAWVECKVVNTFDVGTHLVFVGEVVNCDIVDNKDLMTYQYYHDTFKAKSPKNAPTFRGNNNNNIQLNGDIIMETKKFQCDVCGYVYDPTVGDPDGGIAPGTPFQDIPEDWVCPICGVGKSNFSEA